MRFQKAALLSKKVKRNTENKYYNLQEIKIIFQNCRTKNIDEVEFHLFCDELKVLPRDVVNRISKEIKFVLLSANPKRINPACLLDIGREIKPNTKAIVILTPYIFGAPYLNEKKEIIYCDRSCVLHEIAHYILDHFSDNGECDQEKEEEAWRKAKEWADDWYKYQSRPDR